MSQISVLELLQLCLRTGEARYWEEFVCRVQPVVAGVVYNASSRCGLPAGQVIDDLIQDVFLKIFRDDRAALREFDFRDETSFFSYLKVLATNLVYDHCKYVRADKRAAGEQVPIEDVPSPAMGNPTNLLLQGELDHLLLTNNVSERDRAIFWLYFRQGFSAREISEWQDRGLTVKGVESLLGRLTATLRRSLKTHSVASEQKGN